MSGKSVRVNKGRKATYKGLLTMVDASLPLVRLKIERKRGPYILARGDSSFVAPAGRLLRKMVVIKGREDATRHGQVKCIRLQSLEPLTEGTQPWGDFEMKDLLKASEEFWNPPSLEERARRQGTKPFDPEAVTDDLKDAFDDDLDELLRSLRQSRPRELVL